MSVQPRDESGESKSYTILRVHRYDSSTQAATQKRIIEIGDYQAIQNQKLDLIRSLLVSEGVFDSPDVGSPFCDEKGSELSDTTNLKVYFNVVGADAPKDEESSESAGRDLNVYYKKKRTRTELDDETKDFLKKQLDLNLKDQELSEADVKRLKSTFDLSQWKATAGAKQSHAADLSESEWSIITRTNCLLSGHKMVVYRKRQPDGKTTQEMRVERSPYSAFRLKKRDFEPYEISANRKAAGVSYGTPTAATTSKLAFRIPRFRVDDNSQVSVYETQNALETSLAKSAFSETSVEASAGGGFWGVSAAVSAGFSHKDETQSVTAKSEEKKVMNIVYKFPRVTLYLDPGSLEVTDECDIFSQRAQLGGSLFASEDSTAVSNQTKESKAKAMKASAAASFSSAFAQASASASHSNGSSSGENKSNQDLTNSMAWEAIGGDSLLCNNPPAWCATVGDFYNWRVIEQNGVLPLYKVLSLFDGFDGIQHRFEASAQDKYQPNRWVTFKFELFDRATQNPLAVYKGDDKSLRKHLSTEFRKLADGVAAPFDKYKKDTLAKVAQWDSTLRCDDTKGGSQVWMMRHNLSRGQDSHLPGNTKSMLQNVNIDNNRLYVAFTDPFPGYYNQRYLYPSDSWYAGRNFCLEPFESNHATIEEGTEVWLKATHDNRYLAKAESGLVTLRDWDVAKANEFLVFQVRNIKMESE
ncbi:hypothetical protein BDV27DRAFT_160836 [Aspergillus caelatus]|uniref:MACPF domain-containing protein n=1 Tax=Aspergillus caelatus TaxID=61420 RepID=A0A5N6ZUX3_9EURO|nr:uncharacterized protein BDV27DRAFT_160836 [Aspergillus caelatus]KAE8361322.1 hypothetical protein BDV27DRAFT_160836 [Aspergillus caelatus]